MGIAGLARRLEPYAVRYTSEELAGRTAIIDGPALAYDAHRVAAAAAASLSRIPTYADINAEAIRWLKSLESIDIKVSAILFDGALPVSKQGERLARLQQNIKRVANFRANFPSAMCPVPSQLGSAIYAFLAPTLMEALCKSSFAQVTRMVPGEADDFCASCANDGPRSIIFTSDTDLILYPCPSESIVAFFKDVSLVPNLEFKAYSPTTICQRLRLSGLIPLGYAIAQEPWKSMSENVKDAQKTDHNCEAYLNFSKRYTTQAQVASSIADLPELDRVLQNLDVRVSEFVHHALDTASVPAIYLPLLLEDPYQASAWNLGQDLRTLAYSLLSPDNIVVREYKRKAQSVNIQDHTIHTPEEIYSKSMELLGNISAWMQWTVSIQLSQALIWPLFAVSLTLAHVQQPPSISHLAQVLIGTFNNTWEYVQLAARIQAVSYSLRLLKQCIKVWRAINPDKSTERLCTIVLSLDEALEGLPSIADIFPVPGQPPIRVTAEGEEETLRQALTNIYEAAGLEIPEENSSKKQRKKERKAREKVEKKSQFQQGGLKKASGNVFNVFDVLDRRAAN